VRPYLTVGRVGNTLDGKDAATGRRPLEETFVRRRTNRGAGNSSNGLTREKSGGKVVLIQTGNHFGEKKLTTGGEKGGRWVGLNEEIKINKILFTG